MAYIVKRSRAKINQKAAYRDVVLSSTIIFTTSENVDKV